MDNEQRACEDILNAFLNSPENRKSAEGIIAKALREPATATVFAGLLKNSQNPGVRQLCGVLFRKKLNSWAHRLPVDVVNHLKETLLLSLVHDSERLVRLAVAHAVAGLGKSQLRENGWPELLPALTSMVAPSQDPKLREIALLIFYTLTEVIVDGFGTQVLVRDVVEPALRSDDADVNIAGLSVVQALIPELEERKETHVVTSLLPMILQVLERVSTMPNACERCVGVLEVMDGVLSLSIKKHRDPILRTTMCLLTLMNATNVHVVVRDQAALVISSLMETKPNFVSNTPDILNEIIRSCAAMLSEDEHVCEPPVYEYEDFDEENDNTTACDIGARLLDSLCTFIHPDATLGTIQSITAQFLRSDNPYQRKASLLITAICSREYHDQMRPYTERLMMTAADAGAAGGFIREAALVAMAFYGEYLQPDSLRFHDKIIPLLLNTLRTDEFPNVRHKVCITLENYCENLGRALEPYVPDILEAMLHLLTETNSTVSVQHQALSTITAILESGFGRPYYQRIVPVLDTALGFVQDERIVLRAAAVEAYSVLAASMGPDEWRPLFDRIFPQIQNGLQFDFAQLREQTYGFYASMAAVFGPAFATFIPTCLPPILQTIKSDDGTIRNFHPFAANSGLNIEGEEEDSTSDDSELEDEDLRMRVHQVVVDEKASAVFAIGAFAEAIGPEFFPYVPDCVEALHDVMFYFDERVRKNVVVTLTHLVISVHTRNFVEREVGYPRGDTLHPITREALTKFNAELINIFKTDEQPLVVGAACDAIKKLLLTIGSVAVHENMNDITDHIGMFLRGEGFCQATEGEDEEGRDKDKNSILIDACGECIEAIANSYGPGGYPFIEPLLPALFELCNPSGPPDWAVTALAALAEIIAALGDEALTPKKQHFADLCLGVIQHPETSAPVMRNAVVMFHRITEIFKPLDNIQRAVPVMMKLLQEYEDILVLDNVVSCMLTMIRVSNPPSPPENVVKAVFEKLPLREDFDENKNVYLTLGWIMNTYDAEALKEQTAIILSSALVDNNVQENVRNEICNILQRVPGPFLQKVSSKLNPNVQEVLKRNVFLRSF